MNAEQQQAVLTIALSAAFASTERTEPVERQAETLATLSAQDEVSRMSNSQESATGRPTATLRLGPVVPQRGHGRVMNDPWTARAWRERRGREGAPRLPLGQERDEIDRLVALRFDSARAGECCVPARWLFPVDGARRGLRGRSIRRSISPRGPTPSTW